MLPQRPAAAVEKMRPIRGHTASGLKQTLTVRVYAPDASSPRGSGSIEIDGVTYAFATREEAIDLFEEYLRRAFARAAGEPNGCS